MKTQLLSGSTLSALAFALLLGCASTPPAAESAPDDTPAVAIPEQFSAEMLMRRLAPRGTTPVFLGISPRLHNRDDETERAKMHAADQASRYVEMAARYSVYARRGGNSSGYLEDIDVDWDRERAEDLFEDVEVLHSVQDHDGTYVLATVAGVPDAPPFVPGYSASGRPEWINNPPEIPGIRSSVGVTHRSRRIRDSIDRADQEALKQILLQTSSTQRIIADRRDVEGLGTLHSTTTAEEAAAEISGFLVVDRYTSDDGRYFYSLVLSQK